MVYKLIWSKESYRSINKLDSFVSKRIFKLIKEFSLDPRSKEIKKLKGEKGFRLRVGDYRIIIDIEESEKLIKILKIGHRKNIYEL